MSSNCVLILMCLYKSTGFPSGMTGGVIARTLDDLVKNGLASLDYDSYVITEQGIALALRFETEMAYIRSQNMLREEGY